ncbi:hypothetical protein HPB48_008286 [Haemaphysalis longicornis]|uniref:Elongation of very long chain fatty acids protein n=1 Tax=Haemaphysalis longicornis TaxID=44386 RepID=A0A9J6GR83_HAELO|nr:hypothetical protein HPB48_008286 [Haemaphysalis longicornis]
MGPVTDFSKCQPDSLWIPSPDRRTKGWALTGNPLPLAAITVTYLYLAKVAGPKWMTTRKPFNLKMCLLVYNFGAACFSAFFTVRFAKLAYWDRGYSIFQGIDLSDSSVTLGIFHLSWWLLVFKIVELADTMFFVLRKNWHQVTSLHVFHHVVVLWNVWLTVTYGSQPQAMFITCVNSAVHVIMYTYYFLSALGPSFRRYLWWKKYLTRVQIAQFAAIFLHAIGLVFAKGCYVPFFVTLEILQSAVFFVWFILFYLGAYKQKSI